MRQEQYLSAALNTSLGTTKPSALQERSGREHRREGAEGRIAEVKVRRLTSENTISDYIHTYEGDSLNNTKADSHWNCRAPLLVVLRATVSTVHWYLSVDRTHC